MKRECTICGGRGWLADLDDPPKRGETPTEKSARVRRNRRKAGDHGLAVVFANLLRGGNNTESARRLMGIGDTKARRIRVIAVRAGLLSPHFHGLRRPNGWRALASPPEGK